MLFSTCLERCIGNLRAGLLRWGIVATVVLGHQIPSLIGGAPGAGLAAYSVVKEALVARNAKLIGEALQQFGLQYNLHRVSGITVG